MTIILCVLMLSGCAGTMMTRSNRPMPGAEARAGDMFGGYPFQAVVVDWRIEEGAGGAGNSYVVLGSLAIDAAIDLVLSPIDLVAWAFGCRKRDMQH